MSKIERESINFKLPKPLVNALRAKARELETTATDLVIQGLDYVLNLTPDQTGKRIDNNLENRLHQLETEFQKLTNNIEARTESSVESKAGQDSKRLSNLEQNLETLARRLDILERALLSGKYGNSQKPHRSSYPYQQQEVTIQPFPAQNLAQRLGLTASSLSAEREKLTAKEFISWTRNRDPRSIGWEYHPEDDLYHPLQQ
jgi:hypothetical protein